MYVMLATRPDLAFAMGALSKHSATPGEEHWSALRCIYHYLRKTSKKRLVFKGNNDSETSPRGYVDADWA